MKQQKFKVTPFWDSRAMHVKTKESRIMITVNMNGNQFRVSVKLKSTKEDYDKCLSSSRSLSFELKQLRKNITDYVYKAESLLERNPSLTKELFIRLFKSETDLISYSSNKTDVTIMFQSKVDELKKDGRFSTSLNCRLAMSSLKRYKSPLYFEDIDDKFLKGYCAWMVSQGNSLTTAQIYLRNLRSVFNEAINSNLISDKHYPFKGFSIGCTIVSKDVLYPEQLKALWEYEPIGIRESRAKAYFFFCYLCNGMNFKDACFLKWKNIKGDILTFVREKTKMTIKSGQKEIKLHLLPEALEIIERLGNSSRKPNDFIFPMLDNSMTPDRLNRTKCRHNRETNKRLSKIGKKLGFDVHLCLNLARHSFATLLKLQESPIAFISEAMGHKNSKTTEHYLKSLPDKNLKQLSSKLMSFK
jgi:integrase/recombinase XerD